MIKTTANLINIDEVPAWDSSMGRNYYDFYAYLDHLSVWHIFGHYQFPRCASFKEVLRTQRVYAKQVVHLGRENYPAVTIKAITRGYWGSAGYEKEFYLPCAILGDNFHNLSDDQTAEIAGEFFWQDAESIVGIDFCPRKIAPSGKILEYI